ncbi:MAG: DUF4065 domain-containing protein [Candidatus Thiodiazotropha taylori]|nr:DUF4065 domain-containing protein [Candidatus Thiodiazotropha taylori]
MAVASETTNCFDVSRFFLAKSDESNIPVTNLKLQKLVYYAQAFYLAIEGKALFDDLIEAWDHGPVAVDLYHECKRYGKNAIPYDHDFNEDVFSSEQLTVLNLVFEMQGRKCAWTLRQQTHQEYPWLCHSEDGEVADGAEITQEEMRDYFSKFVVSDQYVNEYLEAANNAIEDRGILLPDTINNADDFVAWIKEN